MSWIGLDVDTASRVWFSTHVYSNPRGRVVHEQSASGLLVSSRYQILQMVSQGFGRRLHPEVLKFLCVSERLRILEIGS